MDPHAVGAALHLEAALVVLSWLSDAAVSVYRSIHRHVRSQATDREEEGEAAPIGVASAAQDPRLGVGAHRQVVQEPRGGAAGVEGVVEVVLWLGFGFDL